MASLLRCRFTMICDNGGFRSLVVVFPYIFFGVCSLILLFCFVLRCYVLKCFYTSIQGFNGHLYETNVIIIRSIYIAHFQVNGIRKTINWVGCTIILVTTVYITIN